MSGVLKAESPSAMVSLIRATAGLTPDKDGQWQSWPTLKAMARYRFGREGSAYTATPIKPGEF